MSAFPKKFIHYLLSEQQMKYATCMASWFWLGAQSNKGVRGQRNSEEIGVGATRNWLHGGVAFLSSLNACIRIVTFGSECSPTNQIFGNLPWENWLNKSSPQNKIKISKKSWLVRALSILNMRWKNRAIVLKPEQKMSIILKYSSLKRCYLWQFCPHRKPVWSQFHL